MNAAETPQWVLAVAPFVIGVILGRWTKAMGWLAKAHKASHSVVSRGGDARSGDARSGDQGVEVNVNVGSGNVGLAEWPVGGVGAADVHRRAVDCLHRWLPDGATLTVQGVQFAYEMPLEDADTALELEDRLVSLGLPQPTVRASGSTVVVRGELPSGDNSDSPAGAGGGGR